MNNEVRTLAVKYKISPKRVTIKSGAKIIDNQIVVKKKKNNSLDKTYRYLKSRSFDYFPDIIDASD